MAHREAVSTATKLFGRRSCCGALYSHLLEQGSLPLANCSRSTRALFTRMVNKGFVIVDGDAYRPVKN